MKLELGIVWNRYGGEEDIREVGKEQKYIKKMEKLGLQMEW